VGFVAIKILIFSHAVVRVVKREEIEAGMRAPLERALPFLSSSFFLLVGARLLLR
jgi:hypothetical protein